MLPSDERRDVAAAVVVEGTLTLTTELLVSGMVADECRT